MDGRIGRIKTFPPKSPPNFLAISLGKHRSRQTYGGMDLFLSTCIN